MTPRTPILDEDDAPALFAAQDLSVVFDTRRHGKRTRLRAVDDVSFALRQGETLAVVGESGSGKSTLARGALRLLPSAGGHLYLRGKEITGLRGRALREQRRGMQMVFQDPYSSLDPSSTVVNLVGEPLTVHDRLTGHARRRRVAELLDQVGLPPSAVDRYVHEFSGGQRQRIAIARAIAIDPALVVLDEAVSALDVSTQNQILELLAELQRRKDLSYLFISHNLAVVRWVADRTAVMYLGRFVEVGPSERVHHHPAHPYTRALLSAMPVPDPVVQKQRRRIVLAGDPPDPLDVVTGCPFRTRCPDAMDVCAVQAPEPAPVEGGGWAACHLVPLTGAASRPRTDVTPTMEEIPCRPASPAASSTTRST
ncbi:MAG: ABC transporter ATP-binding protein [Pseudonocardia sp.]|nr:ABC transporter ATP-binding protein [Pseudonocardia sp.]